MEGESPTLIVFIKMSVVGEESTWGVNNWKKQPTIKIILKWKDSNSQSIWTFLQRWWKFELFCLWHYQKNYENISHLLKLWVFVQQCQSYHMVRKCHSSLYQVFLQVILSSSIIHEAYKYWFGVQQHQSSCQVPLIQQGGPGILPKYCKRGDPEYLVK